MLHFQCVIAVGSFTYCRFVCGGVRDGDSDVQLVKNNDSEHYTISEEVEASPSCDIENDKLRHESFFCQKVEYSALSGRSRSAHTVV